LRQIDDSFTTVTFGLATGRHPVAASRRRFVHPRLQAHGLGKFGPCWWWVKKMNCPTAHIGEQAQRLVGVNSADPNDVRSIS
jgi:hypothetical protein